MIMTQLTQEPKHDLDSVSLVRPVYSVPVITLIQLEVIRVATHSDSVRKQSILSKRMEAFEKPRVF